MAVTFRSRRRLGHRAVAAVAAIAVMMSMAVAPVSAGAIPEYIDQVPSDLYEPDNFPALASPIVPGEPPQSRTLHDLGDQDWLKMSVVAGKTYLISVGAEMTFGPTQLGASGLYEEYPAAEVYLQLYENDGLTLIKEGWGANNDKSMPRASQMGPTQSALAWTATFTGTVMVRAFDPSGRRPGQYLIWAEQKTPSITGTVTNEDGDPIPGVWVFGLGEGAVGSVTRALEADSVAGGVYTDEDGEYMLFDMGADNCRVVFEPYYDQYKSEWWNDKPDYDSADVIPTLVNSTVSGIDAVLAEADPQIGGRVVDEDGIPVENLRVSMLYSWDGVNWYNYTNTYTDGSGEYRFSGYYTGYVYKVLFGDPWDPQARYEYEYYDDVKTTGEAVTFNLNTGNYPNVDATVTARASVISGRVVDESGAGIADVEVYLDGPGAYVYTDSGGRWAYFGGSESTASTKVSFYDYSYQYRSEYYDDAQSYGDAVVVDYSTLVPAEGIDATLAPFPALVEGTVTDEQTGSGLEGIEVWMYQYQGDNGWSPVRYTFTDENGDYSFSYWNNWDAPCKLAFFDRAGTYASEFWDDAGTILEADAFWPSLDQPTVIDEGLLVKAPRLAGANRFATSVAVAEQANPGWEGVSQVIIASGENASMADPLAASGLVWLYGGAPMLLTSGASLSPDVAAALEDIVSVNGADAVAVTIVGGEGAVAPAVATAIEGIVGAGKVDRIAGVNRYDTAKRIFERMADMGTPPSAAFIANGADSANAWDALALSAVTARYGAPILLVGRDAVPSQTASALADFMPEDVYIAGGTGAVSAAAEASLKSIVGTDAMAGRWAGADRYGTAVAIANAATGRGWLGTYNVGIAATLPDALTGGSSMGAQNGVLLLCGTNVLPTATKNYLADHKTQIGAARIFGGSGAVGAAVQDQITQALGL